jgi:hypothetical protein
MFYSTRSQGIPPSPSCVSGCDPAVIITIAPSDGVGDPRRLRNRISATTRTSGGARPYRRHLRRGSHKHRGQQQHRLRAVDGGVIAERLDRRGEHGGAGGASMRLAGDRERNAAVRAGVDGDAAGVEHGRRVRRHRWTRRGCLVRSAAVGVDRQCDDRGGPEPDLGGGGPSGRDRRPQQRHQRCSSTEYLGDGFADDGEEQRSPQYGHGVCGCAGRDRDGDDRVHDGQDCGSVVDGVRGCADQH